MKQIKKSRRTETANFNIAGLKILMAVKKPERNTNSGLITRMITLTGLKTAL